MENKLLQPGKEYRGIPFWSWNDELKTDELVRQIKEMDEAGLGGYFMHARAGLKTEYLGEEWMKCIDASIQEGKKRGMNSWLYDECGWPSGFAGGRVSGKGDRYQQKWLECEEVSPASTFDRGITLGFYKWDQTLRTWKIHGQPETAQAGSEGQKVIRIFYNINPYYVDVLDKDVIRAFIDSTYALYYEKFGAYFGKEIPGIFTDEPQYHRRCIPWSYILEAEFAARNGYGLKECLPCLYYETEGYEKVRYDFWKTVSDLFTTAFTKQIAAWCEEHHCALTGHLMFEDSLPLQMTATAGVMPSYEYMQLPGIDWLWRRIADPLTPKQVSSVIHQLDKKFAISEMFGGAGWNASFEELKWIAEWQYVLGINLMCQHLEEYSLKGVRKRDFPASLFYQQSWWKEYKLFNDYFARLGAVLTEGKHKARVLLLHPMRSAWILYNNADRQAIDQLDLQLKEVSTYLLNAHIDFDYGDEEIIKKYGKASAGKFMVGSCTYDLVVLPPMLNLDGSTVELLEQYVDNGGKVIAAGQLPTLCEGRHSSKLDKLSEKLERVECDKDSLKSAICKFMKPSVEITDENGADLEMVYYQEREAEDKVILFMVNTSREQQYHAVIKTGCAGEALRIILETGEFAGLDGVTYSGAETKIELCFEPMQSHLLVIDKSKKGSTPAEAGCRRKERVIQLQDKGWTANLEDYNALTLDYCQMSINGAEWSRPMPTIEIQEKLLSMGGRVKVGLKYSFAADLDLNKNKEMYMALEEADQFDFIEMNGHRIAYRDIGWWRDTSFKKLDIKPYLRSGDNCIVMERDFYCDEKARKVFLTSIGNLRSEVNTEINKITYDVEIESIYLIGDFGVKSLSPYSCGERKAQFTDGPFVIVEKPERADADESLVGQGLPFFAGNVLLEKCVELEDIRETDRVYLELRNPQAVLSKIYVNGQLAGTLGWRPYRVDISGYIKNGANTVGIELYTSCRNLLGPHHHVAGEKYSVRPDNFTKRKAIWELETEETEVWRDRYCFVEFGICSPVTVIIE